MNRVFVLLAALAALTLASCGGGQELRGASAITPVVEVTSDDEVERCAEFTPNAVITLPDESVIEFSSKGKLTWYTGPSLSGPWTAVTGYTNMSLSGNHTEGTDGPTFIGDPGDTYYYRAHFIPQGVKVNGEQLTSANGYGSVTFIDYCTQTVVVTPDDLWTPDNWPPQTGDTPPGDRWFFFNDENNTINNSLGSFVAGPGMPPQGEDSVQISVSGTQRRNLATYQFSGTPLADITDLAYSTYNPSAGNGGSANRSGYLNFNVDFDGTDTWQRRLVFLPADNGTVLQDTWQPWDTLNGGAALWRYSGATWPGTGTPGTTPRTWSNILTSYPGVRIRVTDSWLGIRVGEPYNSGYTENIDEFVFGTADGITTYDFETE